MSEASMNSLLQDLKNPDEDVRDQATEELWRIWFTQKGTSGFQALERAQKLMDSGKITQAEAALTDLIEAMPDFAEAINRRAVLYFVTGDHHKAIADCQAVIRLAPIHFGALHGLGLCYAALGDYHKAIQAFREALKIQPFAIQNQRLILECTAKLS